MENDRKDSYSMRTYIGTKTVQAMRMDAGTAKRNGANVPDKYFEVGNASYNPGADGFLVIYDGGYRSWSPAKVFEESYKVADSYVDRMKIELADLNERICKATNAYNTFGVIPDDERWRLKEQVDAMQKYAEILYQRIGAAVKTPAPVATGSEHSCCSAGLKKGGE